MSAAVKKKKNLRASFLDATSAEAGHSQKIQESEIPIGLGQEFLLRVLGLALLQRTKDNIFYTCNFHNGK